MADRPSRVGRVDVRLLISHGAPASEARQLVRGGSGTRRSCGWCGSPPHSVRHRAPKRQRPPRFQQRRYGLRLHRGLPDYLRRNLRSARVRIKPGNSCPQRTSGHPFDGCARSVALIPPGSVAAWQSAQSGLASRGHRGAPMIRKGTGMELAQEPLDGLQVFSGRADYFLV